MKKGFIMILFMILVVFTSCLSFAEEQDRTIIENAVAFTDVYATDVVDTAEHRAQAIATVFSYALECAENDKVCKEFCDIFRDNWGDAKFVIGSRKLGATVVGMAFKNDIWYSFNITHFPSLNFSRPEYEKYDDAIIEVIKYENRKYGDFDDYMRKFGKKHNIKFHDVTPYDVVSALAKLAGD